ncbi:hypothetical protein UFOVP504_26 [uncultured Caudovirales phage]|uniref:Uncharacterized protein n=1 Tax=uncultured Caudovirales phage TaxID=2100421 RepID=A0A6J5Q9V6_9CAUD|nr:hypothetical protein UFOVP504_26 [uncultured Caudovirales phage]CAB4178055.1 hypothetical protein UFOVP1011_24 [uncultured Caudovirales phage]CAB4187115.1 hypothetical protein UFOVP1162_40 [uncultured Caudovirales phage]CAB4218852.1 hypothetical protein UFOVP1611_43 [uncultured Caudovirales phage]
MIDITATHPTKNLMTSITHSPRLSTDWMVRVWEGATLTIRTFKTRKWAEAYASKVMEAV